MKRFKTFVLFLREDLNKKLVKDQRGIALLMVLIIVTLLSFLVYDFSYLIRVNLSSAENYRNGTQCFFLARSGIEACRALCKDNDNNYDALNELWATERPPVVAEGGIVEILLMDENRKININQLGNTDVQKDIYDQLVRLCTQIGLDDSIVDNILDWIDDDSQGNAEEQYYQSLESPYSCKNGKLDSLQELLLIKDITDEIYYGTKEKYGLEQFLTVRGNGKININTADPIILQCLNDELTEDIAYSILREREDKPFKQVQDVKSRIEEFEDNELWTSFLRQTTVVSDSFLAQSTGRVGDYSIRLQALLSKDGKKIYFWKRL